MSLLTISPSPHVRSSMTTQKIMLLVVLALVPAIVAATVVFGPRALFMVIYCAVISMFTELVCQRLMQKEVTVTDGSAMLTGVLLALNLPVTLPLWEAAIGCVFAVAVVKQLFGGLGCNFANPAITGRVFLLLSFGGDMTTWVKPFYYQGNNFIVKLLMDNPRIPDGVTGATPLASGNANLLDLFLGNVGGSLGETSALALLIGGIFLLVMGIISWHTPVAYLGGLAVLELFYTIATGGEITDVLYALLSGHNTVFSHWHLPEGGDAAALRAQAAGSEHYLLSANGIAETGEIINIDGAGNRVASAIYGHKKGLDHRGQK